MAEYYYMLDEFDMWSVWQYSHEGKDVWVGTVANESVAKMLCDWMSEAQFILDNVD